jgi:hypothetical protein
MNITNNHGVIMGGNAIVDVGNLVVGSNARIDSIVETSAAGRQKTIEDVRAQLDELLAVMRENRDRLPPEAVNAIETVKAEVARPAPSKLLVTSVLSGVSDLVKSFGSLSGAIVAVRELVSVVLK